MNAERQALVVIAGGRRLGLPADRLLGVLAAPDIVALPGALPGVAGMIAYAGAPVPVVDLSRLLNPAGRAATGPVAVLRAAGHPLACRVSEVVAFGVEAVEMLDPGLLDLDSLAPPMPARRRPPPSRRITRPDTAPEVTLTFRFTGRPHHIPLRAARRLADDVTPVPVPWAPPTVPALVMVDGEAIPVVTPSGELPLSSGMAFLVMKAGDHDVAVAVDDIRRADRPDGAALDPAMLVCCGAAGPPPPRPTAPAAETVDLFLAFVTGGRRCLLPLEAVQMVRDDHGRATPPMLAANRDIHAVRAWNAQVLPAIDLRRRLGLPTDGRLAHDLVVSCPGEKPVILSVEHVDGILTIPAGARRRATARPGAGDPVIADVMRLGGSLVWLLAAPALCAPP